MSVFVGAPSSARLIFFYISLSRRDGAPTGGEISCRDCAPTGSEIFCCE